MTSERQELRVGDTVLVLNDGEMSEGTLKRFGNLGGELVVVVAASDDGDPNQLALFEDVEQS